MAFSAHHGQILLSSCFWDVYVFLLHAFKEAVTLHQLSKALTDANVFAAYCPMVHVTVTSVDGYCCQHSHKLLSRFF